ncbi:replication-relaxation family protein [Bacillus infantis]|uniref:replication-relaxation family protein n=1 Tax=Bacillus infantis TaxID=324767 RepID=UPI00321BC89C
MRKRDLAILESLEKFKCLTRDQLAAMHFADNANPAVTANRVLKRLRMHQYITANTDRSFQQYTYFPNPPTIKIDSQKIDHYLMIAQGFIDMNRYAAVSDYKIEPKIDGGDFIPDATCSWLDNSWFLEFQNSLYTTKQLYSKIDKYVDYYEKGYWGKERLLIIGKVNLKLDATAYPFKIRQVQSIKELEASIVEYKRMQLKKVETPPAVIPADHGGIRIKIG